MPVAAAPLGALAIDRAFDLEQGVDAPDCLQRQRRDHTRRFAVRRAFAVRSAIWKKGRRAWTQHAASTIGPGLRSASYSLLYPPKASAWKIPA
jgi:hypothetical protein